jgi:hypothetical protein
MLQLILPDIIQLLLCQFYISEVSAPVLFSATPSKQIFVPNRPPLVLHFTHTYLPYAQIFWTAQNL